MPAAWREMAAYRNFGEEIGSQQPGVPRIENIARNNRGYRAPPEIMTMPSSARKAFCGVSGERRRGLASHLMATRALYICAEVLSTILQRSVFY